MMPTHHGIGPRRAGHRGSRRWADYRGRRRRLVRVDLGAGPRRVLAVFLVMCLAVCGTLAAQAYWSAISGTGDNGAAAATSVNQGATPTASVTGQTVTVSWAASTLSSGHAVNGYLVKRYDSVTQVAQTMLSACDGTVPVTACTENNVPVGSWVYSVTPVFATNWQGVESAKSSTVIVEVTPPVNVITLSNVSGSAYKSGDTVYYRGTAAGSFTLTNALTDAGTGPASSGTATLGGTTTGWTHTPSTVSIPSGGPYVSNAFAWGNGTTSSPTEVVTGRDMAGNTATTTLTFVNDTTAPTAGTVSYVNTYTSGRSVSVTFTTGTDAGSGIGIRQLQRASAPLTGGSCGSYNSFANAGPVNPTSPYTDIYVSAGTCYQYRYVVSDNVGNQHTATSASVAKIDYASAVNATTGAQSQWRLGEADTSVASDSFTGSNGTLLPAHTGEVGADWTYHYGTDNEQLINGRITSTDAGRAIYSASAAPSSANYAVEADVYYRGVLSGDMTGVFGRGDMTTPTFYLARYDFGTTSWKIIKYNDQTSTTVGSTFSQTLTVGSTYRLRLELSGSTTTVLKLYVDGVLRVSTSDSSSPYTAAGKAGIMEGEYNHSTVKSTTAGLHLDNFRVTSLRAADSKGTNHGSYLGAVTLGAAGALLGDTNTAVSFDGTNDYTSVTRPTMNDFSVEFWFSSTQGLGTSTNWYAGAALVDNTSSSSNQNDWGVSLRSDGKVTAGVGNPDTTIISASGGYNDGEWHHVVFTRQSSNGALALYVDGAQAASVGSGPTAARSAVSTIAFGDRADGGGKAYAGQLDEVSLYTTVLSASTVTDHYQLGTPPPVEPTGPSGGSVDASGLVGTGSRYSTSTTVSLDLAKGTDVDGVAASGAQLLRATATLTSTGGADGTCGTFGSYALVSGGTDPASPKVDSVADQACYSYRYVVADTLGNPTTYTSGDVKVDTTAPAAPTFAFSGFSNAYASGGSSTVYYRPGAATGGFTVTAAATDAVSGIASYAFPALGTNWSATPGALGVNAYSWSGAPAAPGSPTVTATNNATLASPTGAFTVTADSTAPTTGTVSYVDGDVVGSTVSVSFTTGTDGGSGIGTRLLQRATATLSGGVCGSFGGFATVSNGTNPTSPHVDTVSAGYCYKYQYLVSDNVGNAATAATSANVAKVAMSYSQSVLATSGLVDYWRLGETVTASDSFTDPSGTVLSSHTGEVGPTWTKHSALPRDIVITPDGRVRLGGDDGALFYSSAVPASADYQVEADVHVKSLLSGNTGGVAGRMDTSADTFYQARYDVSGGDWRLIRSNNGTLTAYGTTSAQTLTVGSTYRTILQMQGSTIRLYVDGVLKLSWSDPSPINAAGRAGFRLGGPSQSATVTNTTGLHYDNFRVYPRMADSSGTNHGDYLTAPTLGAAGAIDGDSNTAAQFDGTDDYCTVARQISDDFSIEFWFSSTQGIGTDSRWSQGAGMVDANVSGTNNDFGVSLRSDGRVVAGVGGGGGDTSIVSSSGGYNNGNWHHVVFTRTKATGAFALYVDGALAGSATNNTASLTAPPNLNFGRLASPGNYYAGKLDDVAVYNVVLNSGTITAHYNAAG